LKTTPATTGIEWLAAEVEQVATLRAPSNKVAPRVEQDVVPAGVQLPSVTASRPRRTVCSRDVNVPLRSQRLWVGPNWILHTDVLMDVAEHRRGES
jgi:hypothetical protein